MRNILTTNLRWRVAASPSWPRLRRQAETKTRLVPVWYDVDDAEGLRRLRSEVRGARVAKRLTDTCESNFLAATAALIDRLWADGEFDRCGTEALRLAAGGA